MTTAIAQTTLTVAEILNRVGADGALAPVVDMLLQTNELWKFALAMNGWVRNNNNLSFKGSRTSTEPTPSERDYDEGVAASVSSRTPYEEPTCTVADWFQMDLTKLNDQRDPEQILNDELKAHFRGFSKTFGARVFYGDRDTYPKRIRGLTKRSAYHALSSGYVYDNAGGDASATGNKTSVWIIKFGAGAFQFNYPQHDNRRMSNGVVADVAGLGLFIKDYGDTVPLTDAHSNQYPGVKSYMEQRFGQVVHHPGAIRRVPNISTTGIDESDDFSLNEDYIIDALVDLKKDMGDWDNVVIAVPSIVTGQIWKRIKEKSNVWMTVNDPFGRPIPAFGPGQHPIAVCDAIETTEATVV